MHVYVHVCACVCACVYVHVCINFMYVCMCTMQHTLSSSCMDASQIFCIVNVNFPSNSAKRFPKAHDQVDLLPPRWEENSAVVNLSDAHTNKKKFRC